MTKRKLRSALHKLASESLKHYGTRLQGVYLVDSQGQSDPGEQGDAEVVVVLTDGDWQPVAERKQLARLTFDLLVETEVFICARPLAASAWRAPASRAIKDNAEPIMETA